MPTLTLEGNTLGEKHKHFNKIVQNSIDNKQINLTKINSNHTDIENLLKIAVASKTRNVEYIVEVLKCNDILYVSRAIKQSPWLITEPEYMHIINPEYLHEELFPYMLTKAVNKLLLHIRLHLKDENRIKKFYTYIKHNGNDDDANKWLLNCSIPFIESIIQNEKQISMKIYKRLCKHSIKFLKYYDKVIEDCDLEKVLFLLKSNTEELLDFLDVYAEDHILPRLSQKHTKIVMKKYPNRIVDNFENYVGSLNLSVVAKHLKKEEIKGFLFKYMVNDKTNRYFRGYKILKHFITNMSPEEKFEFVKKIYINKNQTAMTSEKSEDAKCCTAILDTISSCNVNTYIWYEYAPFDVAFVEIKKLVRAERSSTERCGMLSVLINCTRKHPQNINILLKYYYDKHRNEPFKFKIQFVNNVIAQLPTHEFDSDNWKILDRLFNTLEVYIESHNDVQSCLEAIVLYKVLHDETVPDIVDRKFQFTTFKKVQYKLNEVQQTKVFNYLLNFISTKINNKTIVSESDLENVISLVENALHLIKDWNKCIKSYAFIRTKIQELIEIKKDNSWQKNCSSLYNVNKSFRRYMFQESIMLCPGEEVCLNALKYEPQLLNRYCDVMDMLRANDTVSMSRFLAKLRVFWPHSLAQEWSDKYRKQMDMSYGIRAAIEGLFILLPQNQIIDIALKYVPADPKITWNKLDQTKFSLQKNIGRYLYKARPLLNLDIVLLYGNGDYLQFALPSLSAISHNISKNQSTSYITKLLNSSVSLQKYGLHLAFIKLKCNDVVPIFTNIWKNTLNASIRSYIFTYTYNLLCKEKDPSNAVQLWNLLRELIENMAADENKVVFNKLGNPKKIPDCVQGQFYMKSYHYLTSLPPAANCETYINRLLTYAPNIMDLLDDDFIADKLLSPIKEIISSPKSEFIDIMSSFVLFGKTEEEQIKRFRRVLVPALKHAFQMWNTVQNNQYVYKENVDLLLRKLTWDFVKFMYFKKIVVPVTLFTEIKIFMEQKIPSVENYVRYTSWTLTCEYVKLVAEHKDKFCDIKIDRADVPNWLPESAEPIWKGVHIKVSPLMGSVIVKLLKEDTKRYCSTIWWLFSSALKTFFDNLLFARALMTMETLQYMLVNQEFIPSYLVVCYLLPTYGRDEVLKKRNEIREILAAHTSLEVQLHYHKALNKITK